MIKHSADRSHFKGAILIFIGAICFSVKAILIKLAYRHQIDALTLLTLRMTFSLPFFMMVYFFQKSKNRIPTVSNIDYFKIAILGLLGYYTASIFDFWGLEYITASLERLILFIYPTLVVLISFFFLKIKITRNAILALLLTYMGVFVVFQDAAVLSQKDLWKGTVCIFISSVTYAAYLVGSGEYIKKIGSVNYTAIAMMVSCMGVIVHFLIVQPVDIFNLTITEYGFGFTIAIISTVIPTFLVSEGVKLMGANNASIVASIGPVATIAMGSVFLGEPITLIETLGTVLVIGGVVLISVKK